ncbi:hypothetical protein BKA62DRAFT_645501 [Auriculariales sp. MPI-PUGE-AT-0066]|nr:hypothetical protein BKA62DRAFT_645501 [Auriculariales sp. MPI-PUGE-AT-0066]
MPPATRRSDAVLISSSDATRQPSAPTPMPMTEDAREVLRLALWDEFRDEQYEAMEMLPLQLRRQSALLRELDEHGAAQLATVQDLARRYYAVRHGSAPLDQGSTDTREILTALGRALAAHARAAEERFSIASSAYASVDRHVRAMDDLIKEHEEVGAAGGVRRVVFGYNQRPAGSASVDVQTEAQAGVAAPKALDMAIDPNEPRYCLCDNVSYGEMVACDNEQDCPHEWFHFACVGLTAQPKGKWFCPDCKVKLSKKKR